MLGLIGLASDKMSWIAFPVSTDRENLCKWHKAVIIFKIQVNTDVIACPSCIQ